MSQAADAIVTCFVSTRVSGESLLFGFNVKDVQYDNHLYGVSSQQHLECWHFMMLLLVFVSGLEVAPRPCIQA